MKTSFLTALFCLLNLWVLSQYDSTKVQEIDAVQIKTFGQKEIMYSDQKYYIMDFHVDTTGTFLLLKHFKKYYVYLLDDRMEPKIKFRLSIHPKSLYHDCSGKLHIMSRDSMYQLGQDEHRLKIVRRQSITRYEYYYKSCIASNSDALIFKQDRRHSQTTLFYDVDQRTQESHDIYAIVDTLRSKEIQDTKEQIEREQKRLALKYGRDNIGISTTDWESQNHGNPISENQSTEIRRHMEDLQFFDHFILRPFYNPLFVMRDTTFIFDHVNGEMVMLDKNRSVLSHHPVSYHLEKKWKGQMFFDQRHERFYSVQEKNGAQIFGLLSTTSQKIIRRTKLTRHAYPEKMIVFNGYVYYVYRQYMDDNLNKLFRQKII